MTGEAVVKHTKTFKKYTEEYKPELLAAVREYVRGKAQFLAHEDGSIVKVTGTKSDIDEMCTALRAKFGPLPGDVPPKA